MNSQNQEMSHMIRKMLGAGSEERRQGNDAWFRKVLCLSGLDSQ